MVIENQNHENRIALLLANYQCRAIVSYLISFSHTVNVKSLAKRKARSALASVLLIPISLYLVPIMNYYYDALLARELHAFRHVLACNRTFTAYIISFQLTHSAQESN